MTCSKFYIIAMAASGKSTFAATHPVYKGYRIVDFEDHLPPFPFSTKLILYLSRLLRPLRKLVRNRPEVIAQKKVNYFDRVFDYMTECTDPVVVFGRTPTHEFRNLPVHDTIKFAVVLIPEDQHRRNCASRKRDLKNPIPFFHHWTTDFDKILAVRSEIIDFADSNDVAVYDSFPAAIDDLHARFGVR